MPLINRREFTESVVLAAIAPVLGVGAVSPVKGWWDPVLEAGGDDLDSLAKALADVVRSQYGKRLGEADIATVTRQIRSGLERAVAMRKVDLANGDEPDFVFSAVPATAR